MGFGKKIKKAVKHTTKSISKAVSKAYSQAENAVSEASKKYLGEMAYDDIKGATNLAISGLRAQASAVQGESYMHSLEKNAIHEGIQRTFLAADMQRTQDEMKALQAKASEYQAAYARQLAEAQMAEAIAKKNAMFGEMESDKAGGRPLNKSYLGSSTTGGYVDDEEIKKKKRLGGDKESSKSGTSGSLA